jgi:hypothetical protein
MPRLRVPQLKKTTAQPKITTGRARIIDNPFRKWRGAIGGFPGGRKEIDAWIREMRGRDEAKPQ